jgi:hypothetical protein
MTIKLADYNKALMTIRLDLPKSRAGQSHVVHGKDSVPDHYGTDLLAQAVKDGADAALQKKLKKILGI